MNNQNGFTLIEILISTVIITIASLGVASLTVVIIRGNSYSRSLTAATSLGQDRLEQVKMIGYDNLSSVEGTEDYGTIVSYHGYKRVTSIYNNTPMDKMKTVTVKVSWDNDENCTELMKCIKLTTILAE